ncbi:MAG: peptidylprolyl isomerase [Angustibacter sp.]
MSSDRERERAKRRYAKQQARLAVKAERTQRRQQVIGAVLAVLIVAGGVALLRAQNDDAEPVVAAEQPSSSPSPSPSPTKTPPPKSLAENARWTSSVKTSAGNLELELFGDKAPQTVASFIALSREKFFDKTSCHRLTTQGIFVLQCGDPQGTGAGGPGYGFGLENAPADGKFPAGTVAMARSIDPNSNGSQFFIVYQDTQLPTEGGGYSIFGKVTEGLPVIAKVAKAGVKSGGTDGPPKLPVTFNEITVTKK